MTAVYIAIGIAILFGLFLAFVASRPNQFRIERTGLVQASPAVVFAIINDFRQWERWSPWEKLDPNMQKTFSGPTAGPGATHTWSGNSKAGAGRNTIIDSKANEYVAMKLEMLKPFPSTNQVRLEIKPVANGSNVTWSMEGTHNFMAKGIMLFMNMDSMVGKDFEAGLANLNRVAQANAAK